MIWFLASSVALGAFWLLLWYMRRETLNRGKLEEKSKTLGGIITDVEKANAARDKLRNDPDYARGVRERFTRKE